MLKAEVRVPPVATVFPGQVAGEGGEEVEEDVGNDHIVVDGHEPHDEQHGRAGTFEEGADLPDGQGPQAGELAQSELEEEEGEATDGQHEEVGHEEGACKEEGGWAASGEQSQVCQLFLKPSSSPASSRPTGGHHLQPDGALLTWTETVFFYTINL